MYLFIDAGNTQVKYMLSNGDVLSTIERHSTDAFLALLPSLPTLKQVLLASVANDAFATSVNNWCQQNNTAYRQLTTEQTAFAINNSYGNYQTMGVDRWLAIVGAEEQYPNRNLIIIDSGTATTIDILSADKQHIGGWIVPGIELMANSLFQHTSKVFGQVADIETLLFGDNTSDNVNFGVWAATIGVVNQAIDLCATKKLSDSMLIFTGGYGERLNNAGKFHGKVISDLVFCGIKRYISC
ncbi:type III pantothenate kinase [Thalassotalea maritima]|uniref:type III pantothenate kinase n=1 Tax=Thalassotalea maritima TaxID=3242416 RepID=UPI003527742D